MTFARVSACSAPLRGSRRPSPHARQLVAVGGSFCENSVEARNWPTQVAGANDGSPASWSTRVGNPCAEMVPRGVCGVLLGFFMWRLAPRHDFNTFDLVLDPPALERLREEFWSLITRGRCAASHWEERLVCRSWGQHGRWGTHRRGLACCGRSASRLRLPRLWPVPPYTRSVPVSCICRTR